MLTDYYSVAEVAEARNIAKHTLLARIRADKVPATKIGGVFLIHKDVVETIQPPTPSTSRRRQD